MFLYCDLVQNEILGDTQTALLRSIPLERFSWTDHRERKEVNHRSFSNLQWKRIYKSQFQSITLTLANEMGKRMPFLSCGRTSITLALRTKPCWRERLTERQPSRRRLIILLPSSPRHLTISHGTKQLYQPFNHHYHKSVVCMYAKLGDHTEKDGCSLWFSITK